MDISKKPYVKIKKTPRGIAVYPRLNKPDEYKGQSKYKVRLRMDTTEQDVKEFVATVRAAEDEACRWAKAVLEDRVENGKTGKAKGEAKKKLEALSAADSVLRPVYDDDGEETEFVEILFRMNSTKKGKDGGVVSMRPGLWTAKNEPIDPRKVIIGGGSLIRVSGSLVAYFMESEAKAGITPYMNDVKVLKLVEFSGGQGGFDDDDDDDDAEYADDLSEYVKTNGGDQGAEGTEDAEAVEEGEEGADYAGTDPDF